MSKELTYKESEDIRNQLFKDLSIVKDKGTLDVLCLLMELKDFTNIISPYKSSSNEKIGNEHKLFFNVIERLINNHDDYSFLLCMVIMRKVFYCLNEYFTNDNMIKGKLYIDLNEHQVKGYYSTINYFYLLFNTTLPWNIFFIQYDIENYVGSYYSEDGVNRLKDYVCKILPLSSNGDININEELFKIRKP